MPNVAKTIAQQTRKQIGKITEEVLETAQKTAGDMTGTALEQLGVTTGGSSSGKSQKSVAPADEKAKLAQREKRDQVLAQQRIREIEAGIEKWRRLREEQLRRRREQMEQAQVVAQQEAVSGALPTGGGKPKRGSLFLRKRDKGAEMAASKRSG